MIPPDPRIRPAEKDDVALLPEIERASAALFAGREAELGLSTDGPPAVNSVETFRQAQAAGRLWVAVDAGGRPVGFALVTEIDGLAHLEEIDVLPAAGRQGLGAALVETVCAWARTEGYTAVTLSTFRDVPWNGPFYRRRGFAVVEPATLSPGLKRLVEKERAQGLRTDLRVIMRRSTRGV